MKWAMCPSAASGTRWPVSILSSCTPKAAPSNGSKCLRWLMALPETPAFGAAAAAAPPQSVTLARLALALLAGLAQAASLAWPFSSSLMALEWLGLRTGEPVWWLGLLALAVLAWLLTGGP